MPIVAGTRRDGGPASMRLCSLLLGAALLIPWLVEAQQQQKHGLLHDAHHHDLLVAPPANGLSKLEATRLSDEAPSERLETPIMSPRRKSTLSTNNSNVKNGASAIATLAPVAATTRRAPGLPGQKGSETVGLSTPQSARSLEDWEVEDFVLLATVDGKLYARDRKTGRERWAVEAENPMVETTYYRRNRSLTDDDYRQYDDYLWIVEPSRDGNLFMYTPRGPVPGLVNTHLTMKKLVEEMSPYAGDNPPILYTGEKKTTMVTLDARTGKVLKWFGSSGALVKEESCSKTPGLLDPDNEECSSGGTITLGRIEYIVSIHDKDDGRQIATLKYTEWSPNSFDDDLQRQYRTTLDSKYFYSSHDGGIIGYDHSPSQRSGRQFMHQKFPSPVVRVFDVARPWGTEEKDPELVILPQPIPPFDDEDVVATQRSSQIFLNHTEDGSWYAMSGVKYPMAVTGLKRAQGSNPSWWTQAPAVMSDRELSTALVGLHTLDIAHMGNDEFLALPASDENHEPVNSTADISLVDQDLSSVVQVVKSLPEEFVRALLAFIINPIWILVIIAFFTLNLSKVDMWSRAVLQGKLFDFNMASMTSSLSETTKTHAEPHAVPDEVNAHDTPGTQVITINATPTDLCDPPAPCEQDSILVKPSDPVEKVSDDGTPPDPHNEPPLKDKKRTHRGRRGGLKHKKPKSNAEDGINVKSQPSVDDVVRNARKLGEQQAPLEPDVQTINNGVSEVSGPILRMGSLICNTDKLIGTGSNGTMVFEGEFDGRPVAVKRMLIQFFDIASQETRLLRESDDHPNVIRYFAQQSRDGFLYIALELCPASLADVIEKPQLHRDLAQSGERDLPAVLYQITNGLQHLHALRIVHRDLKPQNILISPGKDSKPRLLVSDFGLCKKLDGEQSSFRATTAHAAGTSGWRAPELLLDDDNDQTPALDTSTHSGSDPSINGGMAPSRRATRAIDIFSLGLVFFYVLTKGCHPFDCGGRYLREVNIRKNIYDLGPLEALGDYSYEAKDLISSMLEPEPKQRPLARQVMAHPFFWPAKKRLNFLCDVSDHFEKEPRDPASASLAELEKNAAAVCRGDFLKPLGKDFVDSLGKQRKYTGTRLLDLLRALRNKRNHYEDMPEPLKRHVGSLPEGYLSFWTRRFPHLLITCWNVVYEVRWDEIDRFREYYEPAGL